MTPVNTSATFVGQMNIFDFIDFMAQSNNAEEQPKTADKDKPSLEDYLGKGERLTTLAKEKFKKFIKNFSFSSIEKKIYRLDLDGCKDVRAIASKVAQVIRPVIKNMTTFDETDPGYQSLRELIGSEYDFSLKPIAPNADLMKSSAAIYLKYRQKKSSDLVLLKIKEKGWPEIEIIGYKDFPMTSKRNNQLYKDGSRCSDIALVIAYLILFTQYNKAMGDAELYSVISEKTKECLKGGDCFYTNIFFNDISRQSGLYRYLSTINMMFSDYIYQLSDPVIVMPFMEYQKPSEDMIRAFKAIFPTKDFYIKEASHTGFPLTKNIAEVIVGETPKNGILLSADMEYYMALTNPLLMFSKGVGKASLNRLVSRMKISSFDSKRPLFIPSSWSLPGWDKHFWFGDYLGNIITAVFSLKGRRVEAAEYYDELEKERAYARSYQTKQNIPKKTLEAMEKSGFNDYFGYVEFDEDVDLTKVEALQGEFTAFFERFLAGFDLSKVSLRFRRLGNHKASGLYYPNISCLCVDINSPGSFIHELGHCIDHTATGDRDRDLSDMPGFMKVYVIYSSLVKKAVSKGKIVLKGKYNLNYYLVNTEAFARCWEMYVVRILKMGLSICKPEMDLKGFAYPDDKRLMDEIKSYFDALLKSISVTVDSAETAA